MILIKGNEDRDIISTQSSRRRQREFFSLFPRTRLLITLVFDDSETLIHVIFDWILILDDILDD